MKCPSCGKDSMVSEVRDETYEYRGQTLIVPLPGDYCAQCGEGIFTASQTEVYLKALQDFRDQVDASPLAPSEIRRIRKRFGLTQKAAGELFGGGIRAFSQYERGLSRPGKSTDTLLKLLDRHPDLLDEVRRQSAA